MPIASEEFQGCNGYRNNQKVKPTMTAGELTHHWEALVVLLMFPALSSANLKKLHAEIKEFVNV